MPASDDVLLAQAHALCESSAFRSTVWRHHALRRSDSSLDDLCMRIHPGDQMLRHSLRHFADANSAVSQYFAVALQQHATVQQLLALLVEARRDEARVLDFACGFGRSLRFAVQALRPRQIWASEIQPEAVAFVEQAFGVNGLASAYDPQDFQPGAQFDFIWVASLFSHLPEPLFHRWLQRLVALLAPGGALCFSVHDESLLPPQHTMPASGIFYASTSEIEELDSRAYGTSFVSESFVRAAIAGLGAGAPLSHARLPRALANEQDVYVVAASPRRDLSALERFRRGMWGWVDVCRVRDDGTLYVAGWAASLDDGPANAIEITLNGTTHHCTTRVVREDVRAALRDERMSRCGWEGIYPLEGAEVFVEVSAQSAVGERGLLYAGPVRAAARQR